MDKESLRHIMAAILVAEELRVPSIRSGDQHLIDDLLRKQFTPMVVNTYIIVDLMFELSTQIGANAAGQQQQQQPDSAAQLEQQQQQQQQKPNYFQQNIQY